jgi:hypothetical protein
VAEPEELGLAYLQAEDVRSKGAFHQYLDPFCRDLAEAGYLSVSQVGADRDLGSRTGSMVEALEVEYGQSAPALNVF